MCVNQSRLGQDSRRPSLYKRIYIQVLKVYLITGRAQRLKVREVPLVRLSLGTDVGKGVSNITQDHLSWPQLP